MDKKIEEREIDEKMKIKLNKIKENIKTNMDIKIEERNKEKMIILDLNRIEENIKKNKKNPNLKKYIDLESTNHCEKFWEKNKQDDCIKKTINNLILCRDFYEHKERYKYGYSVFELNPRDMECEKLDDDDNDDDHEKYFNLYPPENRAQWYVPTYRK